MFSWSFKWLWAQCLVVAGGFFLLGHMTLPNAGSLTEVKGNVEKVGMVSRKGLGGFYELTVSASDGEQDRVLVSRGVAVEETIQKLLGHTITAEVNWSSEAVQLSTDGDVGFNPDSVRTWAAATKKSYDNIGLVALFVGVFLGLATFGLRLRDS